MKNYCFNYKFLLLIFLPICGAVAGVCTLIFAGESILIGVLFLVISLFALIALLINEPIYYIINNNGISIYSCVMAKSYAWKEILPIDVAYDPIFTFLFIKNYIIHDNKNHDRVERMNFIVKCRKTTKLLNLFCPKVVLSH